MASSRVRGARVASRVAMLVLVALHVLVATCAFPARAAWADSRSIELSDDGRDYGWLYREGDVLYLIDDVDDAGIASTPCKSGDAILEKRGDLWYPVSCLSDSQAQPNAAYYGDGTVVVSASEASYLDAVVRSGYARPDVTVASPWFGPEDSGSSAAHPRIPCLGSLDRTGDEIQAADVTRLVIADDVAGVADWTDAEETYLDRAFEGMANLREVHGLGHLPTASAVTMARLFNGCASLEDFDLTGFDTRACTDLEGMFDGCASMTTLRLGENWTQAAASDEAHKATFPVIMRRASEDGTTEIFPAGEVIPDGAGTYEACDPAPISEAVVLLANERGETCDARMGEQLTCEYTGGEVMPYLMLTYGDRMLVEGVDYEVSYADNVEEGTARLTLQGLGAFCGDMGVTYKIADTGAYAFLYDNGLLVLKAGHERPGDEVVSSSRELVLDRRWFDPNAAKSSGKVPWASSAAAVKRVVVDPSFRQLRPQSMATWFSGCSALTTIEGLENIDGSAVLSMANTFKGCSSLVELDLSDLQVSKATNLSGLVSGCTKLKTLDLGGVSAVKATTTSGFFTGCDSLTTLVTGSGFKNAATDAARLKFPRECYRTSSSYRRMAKGAALPSGVATYRLRDLAMQFVEVEMTTDNEDYTFTCTGSAIKPKIVVTLGSVVLRAGTDYTVSYSNNLYPGAAKLTIRGMGAFSGGLTVPFTIKAMVTHVGDRLTYKTKVATYVFEVNSTTAKGTAAEVDLVEVKVLDEKAATLTLPNQCTINGAKITLTTVSSKLRGNFRNVRSVIIGSKVTTIGSRAFSRTTKVTSLVIKSSRLKSVKNCLAGSRVTKVTVKVKLSSSKRSTYKTWFTKKAGKKGVRFAYSV